MARDEDLLDKNFPEHGRSRGGIRITSLFAIMVVVIFIVAVGYFYLSSGKTIDPNNLPLITENNPPEKVKPADPGGMEIPHQDASVYDHLDAKQANADQPEKLLPAPEAPVTPSTTPTAPVTTAANIPSQLPGLPAAPTNVGAASPQITPQLAAQSTIQAAHDQPPLISADTKTETPAAMQPAASAPNTPVVGANNAPDVASPTSQNSYRIQLGAVRDEGAAQAEWVRMQKKYADQLKGLSSSFAPVSLGDKGNFLRIQAGPLTREDAEARCAKLKSSNQACLIVKAAD